MAEDIKKWDTNKLIQFMQQKNVPLKDTHFNILYGKKIAGCNIFDLTEENFQKDYGMELGPASILATFAKELKEQAKKQC